MIVRYLLYLLRWQLSTPVLAFCAVFFARCGSLGSTVIANFIGGLIFFWIDRSIFSDRIEHSVWSVRDGITCADCGRVARGYRLVSTLNYDRRHDPGPSSGAKRAPSGS